METKDVLDMKTSLVNDIVKRTQDILQHYGEEKLQNLRTFLENMKSFVTGQHKRVAEEELDVKDALKDGVKLIHFEHVYEQLEVTKKTCKSTGWWILHMAEKRTGSFTCCNELLDIIINGKVCSLLLGR